MAADIQAALVAFLQGKGEVTALLGAAGKMRLYPEFAPLDAAKDGGAYATYRLAQENRPQTLKGKASIGVTEIQIDVWAAGADQGHKSANAVYLALWGTKAAPCLDGYRGPMGSGDARVFVQRVQCRDGSKNSPASPAEGKPKPDATCSLIVSLWFNDN